MWNADSFGTDLAGEIHRNVGLTGETVSDVPHTEIKLEWTPLKEDVWLISAPRERWDEGEKGRRGEGEEGKRGEERIEE